MNFHIYLFPLKTSISPRITHPCICLSHVYCFFFTVAFEVRTTALMQSNLTAPSPSSQSNPVKIRVMLVNDAMMGLDDWIMLQAH